MVWKSPYLYADILCSSIYTTYITQNKHPDQLRVGNNYNSCLAIS